jgi:hypothetical protein
MMRSIIATALALAISAPALAGRTAPALAGGALPALAQAKPHRSVHVEKAEAAPPRQSSIITSLSQWGEQDLAAAVALSTSIPELQDPVGSACWKSWSAAGAVVKAHPLPLSLKLATDVEAARLVAIWRSRRSAWTRTALRSGTTFSTRWPRSRSCRCRSR